ncbi:5-methylcytosine-specific restriction protein A [Luteibacter sp. Sphag1AF]|uniref:HNH endonuclease n=1 Tax=Luteibacter sp. Sphag1AF TaxID=2587031 RepID=UPI001622061A|nr:HNH endonuclease [Luteibacter sp. Sphag1AF]MBB3227710.1 5-methylcytosine-specific restriction protein A [Luteibacter sp. Sphag1AF]
MAAILADFPDGLDAAELARQAAERFPELLTTPGRRHSPIGQTPMAALTRSVHSEAKRSKRFIQEDSVSPVRITLISEERPWTDDELMASVRAYMQMREKALAGQPFVKAEVYRVLGHTWNRSPSAFERRMQNISAVLHMSGKAWIKGLVPASNVGAVVAQRLEGMIAEVEQREPEQLDYRGAARRPPKNLPGGSKHPSSTSVVVKRYARDPDVRAWVLKEANGVCDCCGLPAPFHDIHGPFLEVHHVRRLADRGSDTITNAVALCPNCHRRLHHGLDSPALVDGLYASVPRLRRESVDQ